MISVLKLFFSFLLAYIAWLQLNDPDPLFWTSLYLLCALIPLLSLLKQRKKYVSILAFIAATTCLGALIATYQGMMDYLLFHMDTDSLVNDMNPNKPYIEEGREFIGTLIAFLIVVFYWYSTYKVSNDNVIH